MFQIFMLGCALSYLIGDFFGKSWANQDKWWLFALAMFFYILGEFSFLFALKKGALSLAVSIAPLLVLVAGTLLGHLVFGERLTTWQYAGIAFAILAIVLLNFEMLSARS